MKPIVLAALGIGIVFFAFFSWRALQIPPEPDSLPTAELLEGIASEEPAGDSLPAEAPLSGVEAMAERPMEDSVGQWIRDLDGGSGGDSYRAARALGESAHPRAAEALLERLRRGEYEKVSGAAAYFVSLGDASLDPLLLELLYESKDLAVAQAFIESGHPTLSEASIEWAATVGLTWDGETWQQ